MEDNTHCDDYVNSASANPAARWFIFVNRLPAGLQMALIMEKRIASPRLFADHRGKRVRVVMASRLGDLGITSNLEAEHGYTLRVFVDDLENFSESP